MANVSYFQDKARNRWRDGASDAFAARFVFEEVDDALERISGPGRGLKLI